MTQPICLCISASANSTNMREALDLVFAYASFDFPVRVIFRGPACAALLENSAVYSRVKLLGMYDIDQVHTYDAPVAINTAQATAIGQEEYINLLRSASEVIML